jgi:hypothetical protein
VRHVAAGNAAGIAESAEAGGDHPRKGEGTLRDPAQSGIWGRVTLSKDSAIQEFGDQYDIGTIQIGQRRRAGDGSPGLGFIIFASVLLGLVGFFNLIYGIAAIAQSHVFVANAHYVFGSLRTWGWITLILAVLQVLAAAGVLAGNQLARWFAVAVVGLNAINQMLFLPAYPFWSLIIIAMDVVALYGLCAYSSRRNIEAA